MPKREIDTQRPQKITDRLQKSDIDYKKTTKSQIQTTKDYKRQTQTTKVGYRPQKPASVCFLRLQKLQCPLFETTKVVVSTF